MSDHTEWREPVLGDQQHNGHWRTKPVWTPCLSESVRVEVAGIIGADPGPDMRISQPEIDREVFGDVCSARFFVVTDGDLYLVHDTGTFKWKPAASVPIPDTWQEARAWLVMASEMIRANRPI